MSKNIQHITKPRDATSVIIIRRDKNKCYILMGRRPKSAKFMPGFYVFPGGALDSNDYYISHAYYPKSKISNTKLKTYSHRKSKALLCSAIRETAEETGLFLGKKVKNKKTYNMQKSNIWQKFSERAFVPDLSKLTFFGRAITPSFLKTRYHARFFIASYKSFFGEIRTNGELEDIKWIDVKKINNINMADVTEFMIGQVIKINGKVENINKNFSYPMFTWRNKKRWIKWEKHNE